MIKLGTHIQAMVHSSHSRETVQVVQVTGNNTMIVKTQAGIKCEALYSPYSGVWYADDKYSIIKE